MMADGSMSTRSSATATTHGEASGKARRPGTALTRTPGGSGIRVPRYATPAVRSSARRWTTGSRGRSSGQPRRSDGIALEQRRPDDRLLAGEADRDDGDRGADELAQPLDVA